MRCANCQNDKGVYDAMMDTQVNSAMSHLKIVQLCKACNDILEGKREGELHSAIQEKQPRT